MLIIQKIQNIDGYFKSINHGNVPFFLSSFLKYYYSTHILLILCRNYYLIQNDQHPVWSLAYVAIHLSKKTSTAEYEAEAKSKHIQRVSEFLQLMTFLYSIKVAPPSTTDTGSSNPVLKMMMENGKAELVLHLHVDV